MILNRPLITQCKKCGEIIEIDFSIECVGSYERPMGNELEYYGELSDFCPQCNYYIEIQLSAWEYPVGTVNYYETETKGIELLEYPELSCDDTFYY